ncbi:MAG: dockerin type I repeat-containing protein [Gemmatimonadota bacterium]|nr:MAG: dockerin type I repeat-containing protein [Gemmatimonadota bacterium]
MGKRYGTVVSLGLMVLFLSGSSHSSGRATGSEKKSHGTVLTKIERSYQSGEIDYETALMYKVYAIDDFERLPEEYRAGVSEDDGSAVCGTPTFLEVRRNWGRLSTAAQRTLKRHLERPTLSGPEIILKTTHFRIHYTHQLVDAFPDSLALIVGMYAEHNWSQQCTEMHWDEPPSDYGLGGDDLYDIYIKNIKVYGYVSPEQEGPDPDQEDWTSYIVVTNEAKSSQYKKIVAHEFNHACEISYSWSEHFFWLENCANWMAYTVYSELLESFTMTTSGNENPLSNPWLSITALYNRYMYSGCAWVFFLTERYSDIDLPRRIWVRNSTNWGEHTIADIDYVLAASYGSSFNQALKEYCIWRYFTGPNDDGQHFSFGGNWVNGPYIKPSHIHSTYPASGDEGDHPLDFYGTSFIQFDYPEAEGQRGLSITFDGQDGYDWAAMVAFYPGTEFTEIQLDGDGAGTMAVSWEDYDRIVLIPVVLSSEGTGLTFTYSASQTDDLPCPTMERIAEPQGRWYNTAPSFSNFGFDDDGDLDDGWYQINSCSGQWINLFLNVGGFFWDSDGWAIPGFGDLPQGSNTIYFKVRDRAGNEAGGCRWSWQFFKDTVFPDGPTNVTSASHQPGVWSNAPTVEIAWTDATDPGPGAGLDGYATLWDKSPLTLPDSTVCVEGGVGSVTSSPLSDGSDHYFHIRCVDRAGNWGSPVHVGPFCIDRSGPVDGSISINSGAETTFTNVVTLDKLGAVDEFSGLGSGARMRFSNDGVSWSEAEDYADVRSDWDLTAGEYGGTPFAGTKTVFVQFQDAAGNWSDCFQDTIEYMPSLVVVSTVLCDGFVGFAYSEALLAVGGTAPYRWDVISGFLPDGLGLDSLAGMIFGTPTAAESTFITIEVTDAVLARDTQDFSISVSQRLKGDVNADGYVNIVDVVRAVNILLGLETPTASEEWAADCSGDGLIDILDAVGMINAILGMGECGSS